MLLSFDRCSWFEHNWFFLFGLLRLGALSLEQHWSNSPKKISRLIKARTDYPKLSTRWNRTIYIDQFPYMGLILTSVDETHTYFMFRSFPALHGSSFSAVANAHRSNQLPTITNTIRLLWYEISVKELKFTVHRRLCKKDAVWFLWKLLGHRLRNKKQLLFHSLKPSSFHKKHTVSVSCIKNF